MRRDDEKSSNLSPPPPATLMLQAFRLHGRRELSHLRRSGAWSSSGRRFDNPSPGVATGEERRHKARPHSPFRFRDGGRKASEQISTCGTSRMSQLFNCANRHSPASRTPPKRGGPSKPPAASRVEIFVQEQGKMAKLHDPPSNPQGSQARPRAGRSGRPIGGASAASCREIREMVGPEGLEPPTKRL